MQEYVVPRSMPTTWSISGRLLRDQDLDQRRPQQPVMERVAFLEDLGHPGLGDRVGFFRGHGVVQGWVENPVLDLDRLDTLAAEQVRAHAVDELDAVAEGLAVAVIGRELQGALEVVLDLEEFEQDVAQ